MVDSKQQWKAWVYLAPAIVLLLIFTVWPIINTVRMAFLEGYSGLGSVGGATYSFGIANFTKVLKYRGFLNCLKTTMLLCGIGTDKAKFEKLKKALRNFIF